MPEPLLYMQATGTTAIVSAIIVLTMAGVRRPASSTRLHVTAAVAMGIGLVAGYYVLALGLAWPPANGLDRLLTLVLPLALVIELVAAFPRTPRWLAWGLRLSLAAVTPRIILHGSVYLGASNDEWMLTLAGAPCAAVLASVWGLLAWLAHRRPGVSTPMAKGMATPSAGLTIMMAGYIKGGAASLPLTTALVVTCLGLGLVTRNIRQPDSSHPATQESRPANFAPAILGIGVVGLFGLLFIGRFFGRISNGDAVTILLAPLLCWVTEIRFLRERRPWLVGTLRLILVAIPLTLVLARAKRDFDREMGPLLGSNDEYVTSSEDSHRAPMARDLSLRARHIPTRQTSAATGVPSDRRIGRSF